MEVDKLGTRLGALEKTSLEYSQNKKDLDEELKKLRWEYITEKYNLKPGIYVRRKPGNTKDRIVTERVVIVRIDDYHVYPSDDRGSYNVAFRGLEYFYTEDSNQTKYSKGPTEFFVLPETEIELVEESEFKKIIAGILEKLIRDEECRV